MAQAKAKPVTNVESIKSASTAVAPHQAAVPGYRIAKRVTMPTLNLAVNEPKVMRIDDAFRESKYQDPDPKKAKEKPATICSITDMQTGEVALLLVPEVMKKNIDESYPDQTYVGRIFCVQKLPKRPGKRYFDFEIAELEAETD